MDSVTQKPKDLRPDPIHDPIVTDVLKATSIQLVRNELLKMPSGSWVFLDLDDTAYVPKLPILRTENYAILKDQLELLKADYINIKELIWEMYDRCEYQLVEEGFLEVLTDLQDKGIHILPYTKRRTGYATECQKEKKLTHEHLTLSQISSLGINISSLFGEDEIILKEHESSNHGPSPEIFSFDYQGPAKIVNGAIFTSYFEKEDLVPLVLNAATKKGIPYPPAVATLDDLLNNVTGIKKKLEENEIQSLSIHYIAAKNLYDNAHIDVQDFRNQISFLDNHIKRMRAEQTIQIGN